MHNIYFYGGLSDQPDQIITVECVKPCQVEERCIAGLNHLRWNISELAMETLLILTVFCCPETVRCHFDRSIGGGNKTAVFLCAVNATRYWLFKDSAPLVLSKY